MMLKKVIQYFSVGAALIFGVSCENEEGKPQEFSVVKLEYFARKINKEEVNTIKPEVLKLAENYNAPVFTGRDNDFEVLTDNVLYVQKGDYDSYTFPITRDDAEMEGFENLLISKQRDNTYKAFFVLYDVSLEDQIQYYNGEEMDFSDKVRFIEADTDFEHLITARDPFGGGILNECPFGSCCAPVQGESQGTGLPIITLEIIDCPEPDGSGGSNDSGDTEGNDNNNDEQEDPPSGGNDPNNNNDEEFPNRGGGDGGDGGNTDLPCFDCDTDGTVPTVPNSIDNLLQARLNQLVLENKISFWTEFNGIVGSEVYDNLGEINDILRDEDTFDVISREEPSLQDGVFTEKYSLRSPYLISNYDITIRSRGTENNNGVFKIEDIDIKLSGITLLQSIEFNTTPVIERFPNSFDIRVTYNGIHSKGFGFGGAGPKLLGTEVEIIMFIDERTGQFTSEPQARRRRKL